MQVIQVNELQVGETYSVSSTSLGETPDYFVNFRLANQSCDSLTALGETHPVSPRVLFRQHVSYVNNQL